MGSDSTNFPVLVSNIREQNATDAPSGDKTGGVMLPLHVRSNATAHASFGGDGAFSTTGGRGGPGGRAGPIGIAGAEGRQQPNSAATASVSTWTRRIASRYAVVRRFFRDDDVVHVTFSEALR